jgi:ectoine hydroxylase-related dioxygenase (phytanoyl-CoA dioxygenase family)
MLVSGQRQLDRDGFLVLDGLMSRESLRAVGLRVEELFQQEGDSAGSEFKHEPGCRRLANLVSKGEVFEKIIAHPAVLPHVGHVLGDFKLSSLNVRSVNSNCQIRQPLHADMAALPDEQGPWVCNVLWMLTDITEENGALRVIPGTHRSGQLPQQVLGDPLARHPEEILLTGAAGTVIVINAHLWHGGTENQTPTPRTAMHAFYCRRDKPQQQYQKRLLAPEVQDSLTPELRHLLALDDPLNDRLSAEVAVRSGFMK